MQIGFFIFMSTKFEEEICLDLIISFESLVLMFFNFTICLTYLTQPQEIDVELDEDNTQPPSRQRTITLHSSVPNLCTCGGIPLAIRDRIIRANRQDAGLKTDSERVAMFENLKEMHPEAAGDLSHLCYRYLRPSSITKTTLNSKIYHLRGGSSHLVLQT